MQDSSIELKVQAIIQNFSAFMKTTGRQKVVLGMSGGVDSSLTAKIAVEALGKEHVMALMMPNESLTDPKNVKHARDFAQALEIESDVIPINPFLQAFDQLKWEASPLADMNVNARVRANILYHYANTHEAIVLGTGNKTELLLGYFTKYGDGACDVEVIGELYKTEVWEAAKFLGLPKEIIEKTPTAELTQGQTDEAEMGVSYKKADEILIQIESGQQPEGAEADMVREMMNGAKHKSKMPTVISSTVN